MSQGDVEILRGFYEAFNRGDFDDALRSMDPEVQIYPGVALVDVDRRYRGREAVREFFGRISDGFDVTVDPQEIVEAPNDRVVAVERWHSRAGRGIELEFDVTDVYLFRDGLVVRVDGFIDRGEAFEAAGLRE
jgi:ketosteroid isomerase-like protein